MPTFRNVAIVAGSYLLGGISTGYYLVRLTRGEDVRTSGSGSSGARNVGRTLGKRGFIVTAAGDTGKGAIIPLLARTCGGSDAVVAWSCVAAVSGHVWPVQLGFRGGRGLTVAFGAVLATEPRVGGITLAVAAGLLPLTRNLTGAGLLATASAPLIARLLGLSSPAVRGITGMAAIVLAGHRHHIRHAFVNRRNPAADGVTS
jgi:glycerol-3-phosphate acyltransferase PlsY